MTDAAEKIAQTLATHQYPKVTDRNGDVDWSAHQWTMIQLVWWGNLTSDLPEFIAPVIETAPLLFRRHGLQNFQRWLCLHREDTPHQVFLAFLAMTMWSRLWEFGLVRHEHPNQANLDPDAILELFASLAGRHALRLQTEMWRAMNLLREFIKLAPPGDNNPEVTTEPPDGHSTVTSAEQEPPLTDGTPGHASLYIDLLAWQSMCSERVSSKPAAFISKCRGHAVTKLTDLVIHDTNDYFSALGRWREMLAQFGAHCIEVDMTGTRISPSNASFLEVDIQLNQTWGIPCIYGHSIKGRFCAWLRERRSRLFEASREETAASSEDDGQDSGGFQDGEPGIDAQWLAMCEALFGSTATAGAIVFHDAWWVGTTATGAHAYPFVQSTTTPHHVGYQQSAGEVPPTLFDEPTPIPFPAVNGIMLFAISLPNASSGEDEAMARLQALFDLFVGHHWGRKIVKAGAVNLRQGLHGEISGLSRQVQPPLR